MRVLIVGHGRMGHFHAKTVSDAGDTPVTLDPYSPANLRTWAQVPDDIELAIIATPIGLLHHNTLEALHRGLRVLVEKPAAATLHQALNLEHANPEIAVGYLERLNPAAIGLHQHCPAPASIAFTRLGPRPSSNPTLDVTSHDIDLHHAYWPTVPPIYTTGHHRERIRLISTPCGYQADLVNRTLLKPDGTRIQYAPDTEHDLLAHQYAAFRNGTPAATITDAVHVHRALEHLAAQPSSSRHPQPTLTMTG